MGQELSKGDIPCLGEREEKENPGASKTERTAFEKTAQVVLVRLDSGDRNFSAITHREQR